MNIAMSEELPDETTDEQKGEMYQAAVLAVMQQLAEPLHNALAGVRFPHPLPPHVGSMAVVQAVALVAVGLARDGELKMPQIRDVFNSSLRLGETIYPDLAAE